MLHYLKSVVIIGLACVLVSCSAGSSAESSESVNRVIDPSPPAIETVQQETLESKLDKFMANMNYSGSVLLVKDNEVVAAKGYKMADYSTDQPNGSDTIYQIGSLTKAFTAAAILQLEEAGKLSVDDTVHTYIKDYPNETITLYHLLTHTSGIPNFTDFPDFLKTMNNHVGVGELIARFKDKPLEFEPGSQFHYSNSGYILLGAVIEQVSGQSYGDYLDEHIFTPLGMNRSGYLTIDNHKADVAVGHLKIISEMPETALPIDMTVFYSAGGIYSTVEDLYKWLQGLENGKILSEASWKAMLTPNLANYALGWILLDSTGKVYAHGGTVTGFNASIWRDMSKGTAVILLGNAERIPVSDMTDVLIGMINSEE